MTDNEKIIFLNQLEDKSQLVCKINKATFTNYGLPPKIERKDITVADLIDLINRLQAENERLQETIDEQDIEISRLYKGIDDAKADAIKEFAERLKAEYSHTLYPPMGYPIDKNDWIVYREDVDDLVKEMIGENK
ncbi:MAG: hypothetical protein IKU66_05355 [Clostridia bacterium]|nr:hypothetical protein [Clostridia bacterium]